MKELMKLLQKKKKTSMSPEYKSAKMGILESLKNEMSGLIGDDLKTVKKVTVASDDELGLKKGLDKARNMLSNHSMNGEDTMRGDDVSEESPDEESSEDDSMSNEEIDAQIEKLKARKTKRSSIGE